MVSIYCISCKSSKPKILFARSRYDIKTKRGRCKKCVNGYMGKWRERNRKTLRYRSRYYTRMMRHAVLEAYGNKCICCGETKEEFLTIDHIISGRGKDDRRKWRGVNFYLRLRKLGYPQKMFRILCWNCNCSRGLRGYCPHTKESINEKVTVRSSATSSR